MTRIARAAGLLSLCLLLALSGGWGTLAIAYTAPYAEAIRLTLAMLFSAITVIAVLALVFRRRRSWALAAYGLAFGGVLAGWSQITPSNDRDWQTDVAVLPTATIEGDVVTVHNIRNFDYRSETDYTPAYYTRQFDLNTLKGVDLVTVYWMGPAIAHVFLSFAFDDGQHLAISIETRKEKGEDYSTLKGFFRQYELYYAVGDERDLIRLRTNYRQDPPEDVYIYRLKGSLESGKQIFLEYMKRINELNRVPEFYNTLTTNCTTTMWLNSRVNAVHLPFNWKILASGYVPEYLYEHGRLADDDQPFSVIQQQAYVNPRAHAANDAADFSDRIRAAIPR